MRLPDSVVGRAGAVLLGALLALMAIGYWGFRQGMENVAGGLRERGLAERLVSIQRTVDSIDNEAERDRTAHSLSSASLDVHWSKVSLVLGNAPSTQDTLELERRLKELQPDLVRHAMRIGFADDGALGTGMSDAYAHMLLISLPLRDGSWINFATPAVGIAYHLPLHILLTTLVVGCGIALVALILLHRVTRPLRNLADAAERFSLDSEQEPLAEQGPLEVRRAAQTFNRLARRIRALVAERTQALAAVSHDLRTPITRLRLRTELMDDPELRRPIDQDLGDMEAMIDATLDYLRAGERSGAAFRKVDVVSILTTIVDNETDLGRDIVFAGASHAFVRGDIVALKRGLSNLIDNALKFGSAAKVGVNQTADHVVITITDNGPGIPEADVERVMEPFVRLESSRNRATGGVGLGLTIARSIVASHGGTLRLQGAPGAGLTVIVRLPIHR